MWIKKTSSLPKSVLRYVLDKGQYFDLETSFTQSCFPNKETGSQCRLKCLGPAHIVPPTSLPEGPPFFTIP